MARFLLDAMCGGIRAHLRMCGHDTAYALDRGVEADDELLAIARDEDRAIVTRDRQLAARSGDAILLESVDPATQLAAIAATGIDLDLPDSPTRCGSCNGSIDRVAASESVPEDVPDPAETPVWQCRVCDRHFWKGCHWERVAAMLPER